jgi:DNA-binding transcriptional ArsR family regulator
VTAEAKHLIEEFGALSDPARREVLAELLRLSRDLDYPITGDDELTSAANEIFLSYDDRERDE